MINRRHLLTGASLLAAERAMAQPMPPSWPIGNRHVPPGPTQVANAGGNAGPSFARDYRSGSLGAGATFNRASTALYTNATGTLVSATIDTPRFNYDPVTLQPRGLLLEDASTNIALQSSVGVAPWTGFTVSSGNPTATANNTTAPDGTTTATRIVYPAVSGAGVSSLWYQSIAVTATVYTFSVWLRGNVGGEQTYICVNPTRFSSPRLTLTTQWQRFTFTTPTLTAANWAFIIGTDLADATQTSTPAQTIYAWGAQVEALPNMSSHIPTTSASVTRARDIFSYPIASVTGFNNLAGSMVAVYTFDQVSNPSPGQGFMDINDTTGSNRWLFRSDGVGRIGFYELNTDGKPQLGSPVMSGPTPLVKGTVYKVGSTWPLCSLATNGVAYANAMDLWMHAPMTVMNVGSEFLGFGVMYGHILSLAIYPWTMNLAQLQQATT